MVPIDISAINPLALKEGGYSLPTKYGTAAGTYAVIAQDLFFVAIEPVLLNGRRLPRGTCFVSEKDGRFTAYRSLYRAIRANTYMKDWIIVKIGVLEPLACLTKAHLASFFNLSTLEHGEFARLNGQLKEVLESEGRSFTTDPRTRHAIRVFNRTRTRTRRGSQLLGYGNSNGTIARRFREIVDMREVVLTAGAVLAGYIDRVLAIVRWQRDTVDEVMGYGVDTLVSPPTIAKLGSVACTLSKACIVRPTTAVAWRAVRDCERAVTMLRATLGSGPAGAQGGSEGIRNLVGNVRESLDLLLWQYVLEELILLFAEPAKRNAPLTEEEWGDAEARALTLLAGVAAPFGKRFENPESVRVIRRKLTMARDLAALGARHGAASAIEFKSLLCEASDVIGGVHRPVANP